MFVDFGTESKRNRNGLFAPNSVRLIVPNWHLFVVKVN